MLYANDILEIVIVSAIAIVQNSKIESLSYSPDFGHNGSIGKLLLLIQRI